MTPDSSSDNAGSSRPEPPTPVRAVMGDPKGEREAPSQAPRFRSLEVEDGTWKVRVGGRQETGIAPDPGASLLLLFFHDSEDEETPTREVYAVARELADLSDQELSGLLERSRPYRAPDEEGDGEPSRGGERFSRGRHRKGKD